MEMEDLTIKKARESLMNKEFSAKELCKAALNEIEEKDGDVKAYLEVSEERALEKTKEIDEWITAGRELPLLAGIPGGIKDNILVKGLKCTAGSEILENYEAPYNATVVDKLKDSDALILGKTNMDEFAMGASTEYSAFQITRNPYDLDRVPGGSSGGSAAATAASMGLFCLGSDTGGSIRQPASFCGVVGFKPTYGAVSRYGLIAMASSLDQIGPFAKTVEDAEIVFDAISGRDLQDSTSIEKPEKEKIDINELKIGIPKEYFIEDLDSDVEDSIKEKIENFKEMGATIKEVSLPHTEYALPTYYIIVPSEVSANLARYDGIKYGRVDEETKDLKQLYLKTRGHYLGEEVRRRIMLGTYALSSGYYDDYYLKAQKTRTLIKRDFEEAFKEVDIILTPTTPAPAFKVGENTDDPLTMYLQDIFSCSANLAGLPAISIPSGKVNGLPVGFQLIGDVLDDYKVLGVGKKYEEAYRKN